jgi:fibronectin type 3 domain-containing protein
MNRRNLIKRCGQALLGIGAAMVTTKAVDRDRVAINPSRSGAATTEEIHIFFHPEPNGKFNDYVIKAVTDDIRRSGLTREVIKLMDRG